MPLFNPSSISVPGFGGGIFTFPTTAGATPPFAPTSAPMSVPAGATPPYVPPATPTWQDKLGGVFGVPQTGAQPGLFSGDPAEARKRAIMAAGMQMMASAGPNEQRMNAGQILSQGYLAGQKATDDYQQDAQRRAYMQSLVQQQQAEMEKQKRLQMLEKQRAETMAKAGIPRTPEQWEDIGGTLAAQGDSIGAETAWNMANKLRDQATSQYNAETNRKNAERAEGLELKQGADGFYTFDPKTGEVKKSAGWAQFAPERGKDKDEVDEKEAAIIKKQLAGQISSLLTWAEGDAGELFGSPKAGAAYDATIGRLFGTEDYQQRRRMSMITGRQMLDMAKYLKPMSNSDIIFLEKTMPLQEDAPELWAEWLRNFAERAQIDLSSQGSVYSKYGLERAPSQQGNKPRTGSF